MKILKFLTCTFMLLSFLMPLYTLADSNTGQDETVSLAELKDAFSDKSFAEIEQEFRDDLQQLEALKLIGLSGFSLTSTPSETPEYTDPVMFPDKKTIESTFNHHLDTTAFLQKIYGDISRIYLTNSDYNLISNVKGYDKYNFKSPILSIEKVFFKDGSSMSIDNENSQVNSNKQIISLELLAQYSVPKEAMTKLTFSNESEKVQNDIEINSIDNGQVTFTVPQTLQESIVLIEGLDKQGRTLVSTGSSSSSFDADEINRTILFYQQLLKNIDDKKITDKDAVITYIYQNHSQLEDSDSDKVKTMMMSNTFRGDVSSVNVYLAAQTEEINYRTKITQAKAEYINGLVTARNKDDNQEGIINAQGEWIIQPEYTMMSHIVDNYYLASGKNNNDALYLLDQKQKTLQKQPFFIMSNDIYQGRFVIVNRDRDNNFIKGLVDLKTHQLILPVKYHRIEVSSSFYTTEQYDRNEDLRHLEIYNIKTHKKIHSSNTEVSIDKDNFITKSEVCSKEKPDEYEYSKYSQKQGTQYCYANYYLHDKNGKKINATPYRDIHDKFSDNNLLLVSSSKQKFFVNRQAQKANINLSGYKEVKPFSQGLAAVQCSSNEQYGYINSKGKRVIPCFYDDALYFQGGSAMVEYNGKYQLIRPDNSVIKIFKGGLFSYTNMQDNTEPSYNFDDSKRYNFNGEAITE